VAEAGPTFTPRSMRISPPSTPTSTTSRPRTISASSQLPFQRASATMRNGRRGPMNFDRVNMMAGLVKRTLHSVGALCTGVDGGTCPCTPRVSTCRGSAIRANPRFPSNVRRGTPLQTRVTPSAQNGCFVHRAAAAGGAHNSSYYTCHDDGQRRHRCMWMRQLVALPSPAMNQGSRSSRRKYRWG
jgi:hypothetical protein